jgi:Mg-chelatase subunit ChlD
VQEAGRRTTSRRDLARSEHFEQVSPEVGELDEDAFDALTAAAPDEALALLADLTGATDPKLRALARRLAAQLFLDLAQRGPMRPRGVGKLQTQRFATDRGDLDVDASIEELGEARAARRPVDPDELRIRAWATPSTALCLLLDRSGSMGGAPLATSAVATAAVASRAPDDYSVVAFGKECIVVRSQDVPKSSEKVIDDVLTLRGHGTTDLAGALRAAGGQLARSPAGRKITVLLSDCRATVAGDVVAAARALDEVVIIAPEGDDAEAVKLAGDLGARVTTVAGPSQVVEALTRVFTD